MTWTCRLAVSSIRLCTDERKTTSSGSTAPNTANSASTVQISCRLRGLSFRLMMAHHRQAGNQPVVGGQGNRRCACQPYPMADSFAMTP